MTTCCFTSFTFSYLAKARVLAATVKKRHPDWVFVAVITDREPPDFTFDPQDEAFDEVIWGDRLFGDESLMWLFKHDVVEACTAVKGPVIRDLINGGFDKVVYLDPDIAVFDSLSPIEDMLDQHSILLTPHQIDPDDRHYSIVDNELCSLTHGIYNLGFVAIRNDREGKRFADWWLDRLTDYCYDEKEKGIFTDQKWCDFVPAFFDGVRVIRDPGYNVASWNLNRRVVDIDTDGAVTVNGAPLRFFHFTKLGPIGDMATRRYAGDNVNVYELWAWYRNQVEAFSAGDAVKSGWRYGAFDDGAPIPKAARRLYRDRPDLQRAYPNPFVTEGGGYAAWLKDNNGAL